MDSDDEDRSDSEMMEILSLVQLRRKKVIRARPNDFNAFDDANFYQRFRMSKASAYSVLQLIAPQMEHATNCNHALTAEQMLLMTLRLYTSGAMLCMIGDLYGVSASTVSLTIIKVSKHIAMLRPQFIEFPANAAEREKVAADFYKIAKLPNVIAAFDCTHVKLIEPDNDSTYSFRNGKGFNSIKVQTTCDANLKISNIVARWPATTNKTYILKNSRIYARIENSEFGNSTIVAGVGYRTSKTILTRLTKPETPEHNLYNESIKKTHSCMQRTCSLWKQRFPILCLGLRLDIDKIQSIIVATAVLHNICCASNEFELPSLPEHINETIELNLSVK